MCMPLNRIGFVGSENSRKGSAVYYKSTTCILIMKFAEKKFVTKHKHSGYQKLPNSLYDMTAS